MTVHLDIAYLSLLSLSPSFSYIIYYIYIYIYIYIWNVPVLLILSPTDDFWHWQCVCFSYSTTYPFARVPPICVWTLAPNNTNRSSVWSVVFKHPSFQVMSTVIGMFIVNEWVVRWPGWIKQTSDHGWIFSALSSEVLTCKIII